MPTSTNITQRCVDEQQGGNEEHQNSTTRGHHKHQQNVARGHQQALIEPNKGALTNINTSQKGSVNEHQHNITRVLVNTNRA
jgi:hypothetical protein